MTQAAAAAAQPDPPPPRAGRRWLRILAWTVAGLAGLLVLAAAALWLALPRMNLAAFAASRLSARMGRTVTVGGLHVSPGRVLRLEVSDVAVANAPWGSQPVMYGLRHAVAEVTLRSLLHGPAELRTADIEGLTVLLEHGPNHQPNWRDGPASDSHDTGRAGFPSIRQVAGRDVTVTVKTGSGHLLTTALSTVGLTSADDDAPVALTAAGTQTGVPVTLDATLHPFREFHDESKPFGTDLKMTAAEAVMQFTGTMTDPLGVDGAEGELVLDTPSMAPLLGLGGMSGGQGIELHLVGHMTHSGNDWTLRDATGAVMDGGVRHADLHLHEGGGPERRPDRIEADVDLDQLDLDAGKSKRGSGGGDIDLTADGPADPELRVKLTANLLRQGGIALGDVSVAAEVEAERLTVSAVSATFSGTKLEGSGSLAMGRESGRIDAQATLSAADLQSVRRAVGLRSLPLLGPLQGRVDANAAGRTLDAAIDHANVAALLWMRGGSISREVVEMASTDIRALFRTARGMSPISCMILGLSLRNGVGTVSPLRVRAEAGTISGYGRFDLGRRTLDMTFGSESRTTGLLALDIPVRVSGSFASPSVLPARWTPQGRAALAAADSVAGLPRALQQEAARRACPR